MDDNPIDFEEAVLKYHRSGSAGKLATVATKQLINQRDLSLAYSPGVAVACEAIVKDKGAVNTLTVRRNLVAVVTNGTAVLGLGDIGPMAAKPVMEGKAVLFKAFAGIDVFDLELEEKDPEKLVDIVAALEPTFGGINLEDIKAPDCFYIEEVLQKRMKVPVFHDDQHGTAIVVAAALRNALEVVQKDFDQIKLVMCGAGAAALACLGLLEDLGVQLKNIFVVDVEGVLFQGREPLVEDRRQRYLQDTDARTLADLMPGCDVFIGLSVGGVLTAKMVQKMAVNPIVFALANPSPEIWPTDALDARSDVIIATGRSDFPNQVNNVLSFPYIFRGALDVGATCINQQMKLGAVSAIADLAKAEQSEEVMKTYHGDSLSFGPSYLLPKPFDPRLVTRVSVAVARAAMSSGAATEHIDLVAYEQRLGALVDRSGMLMKPIFSLAKEAPLQRIVYGEGEELAVLQAVQIVVDEGLARPILVGRPAVIEQRIRKNRLRLKEGQDFDVVNVDSDSRYREFWSFYHHLMERKGVSAEHARLLVRHNHTLIGTLLLRHRHADGLLCGMAHGMDDPLRHIDTVIGKAEGIHTYGAMSIVILPKMTVFICDTHVNPHPTAKQIAEITLLAAEKIKRFGTVPKAALLSSSNFGSCLQGADSEKMRDALKILRGMDLDFEVEGEMHADTALNENLRGRQFPSSLLSGKANLLVMPSLDAAHIAFGLLKEAVGARATIGPILLGAADSVHILSHSTSVRRIVNMTALTAVDAYLAAKR